MRVATPRPMSFDVRPVESDASGQRWHWTVYDDPHGCFVRNGQVSGDRDKAERAARAAIAIMGGTLRPSEPAHASSGGGTYRAAGRPRPEVDDP